MTKYTYQNSVAALTEGYTASLQSAALQMLVGSDSFATGRAPGLSFLSKV